MRVIAESLEKGTRVTVTGRLRQRSYEAQDSGKRTVHEALVFEPPACPRGTPRRSGQVGVEASGRDRGHRPADP